MKWRFFFIEKTFEIKHFEFDIEKKETLNWMKKCWEERKKHFQVQQN